MNWDRISSNFFLCSSVKQHAITLTLDPQRGRKERVEQKQQPPAPRERPSQEAKEKTGSVKERGEEREEWKGKMSVLFVIANGTAW